VHLGEAGEVAGRVALAEVDELRLQREALAARRRREPLQERAQLGLRRGRAAERRLAPAPLRAAARGAAERGGARERDDGEVRARSPRGGANRVETVPWLHLDVTRPIPTIGMYLIPTRRAVS
jgi:hypothetical protein